MYSFKEFGIKPTVKAFEGDKIKIERIINKLIVVSDFKIDKSKFDKGSGKLLTLQIIVDNGKRVLFTGSTNLIEMIQAVPKEKFPFETIITKDNDRYEFT
jgi:hypothetical protein